MIAETELAITAALKAASDAGQLAYPWRTLESYPEDFDSYLKERKVPLRVPAAWAVFLGLAQGVDNQDDDAGWTARGRFALVVAAQNLRGETETRHGGPDLAIEPGSYQLAEDAVRVLSQSDLGFLARPIDITGMRLVARSAEIRKQGLSLMALELECTMALARRPDEGNPGDFEQLHVDWDVPEHGNAQPPLPAAENDAEDLMELPQ